MILGWMPGYYSFSGDPMDPEKWLDQQKQMETDYRHGWEDGAAGEEFGENDTAAYKQGWEDGHASGSGRVAPYAKTD